MSDDRTTEKNPHDTSAPAPYIKRQGDAEDGTLRTYVMSENHLTIMGTTQGYNDERDQRNAEEIALVALFMDPALRATAAVLAVQYVGGLLDFALHAGLHHMVKLDLVAVENPEGDAAEETQS